MDNQTLRIIDANLDRATEGLRVLEDTARFVLDNITISRRVKEIRHSIHQSFPDISINLISARDTISDVGRRVEHQKEGASNFIDTVIANARRVEQSLRVLEELSRLPDSMTKSYIFEHCRYSMYEIEKELVSHLSRNDKCARLGSYVVVSNETEFSKVIERKPAAIQIEQGTLTQREFHTFAERSRESSLADNILLIIEGNPGITVSSKADGIALDEYSLPISVVRGLLKIDQVIGYAAKSPEEAIQAESCGADYIMCHESLKQAISLRVKIPVISPFREDNP
jgi:thiamine-phosphate pyrophosphorylase